MVPKRPRGQIEHTNLTVSDPERSSALFQHLLGWHERWRGEAQGGGWTIHVGDETTYLALYTDGERRQRYAKGVPLNHVGLLVDDLPAAERVVSEAGLQPFGHGDYEPGRRFYFFDWDGIEFEVVSYQ
jgi:catechol 2,3-dioxygenase-like lactoylglutathione lyase family enzyme